MQILTVDVGTGTQDVLLFDSERALENCFKLIMPSPTVVVAERIRAATRAGERLVLTGVTMGGGPSHWAARDHVQAGLPGYATPDAARTFDDDLDGVRAMGIEIIAEDEVGALVRSGAVRVEMRDLWFDPLLETFERLGARARPDIVAVATFDHGAAPPGQSDRVFRFAYLRERLTRGLGLAGFGFRREDVPEPMTRLRAAADSIPADLPALVMDTAPAAVLGALEDARVMEAQGDAAIVANIGNFHCLAFHFVEGRVAALFEHHTGELTAERLRYYIERLRDGSISNDEVFADNGHGALVLEEGAPPAGFLAATGPRRALLGASGLDPYLAVPHGDMMLTGNFGLLRAVATHLVEAREAIEKSLEGG